MCDNDVSQKRIFRIDKFLQQWKISGCVIKTDTYEWFPFLNTAS